MQRRKVGRKVEGGKGEWKGGSGEERKKWWMKEGEREGGRKKGGGMEDCHSNMS